MDFEKLDAMFTALGNYNSGVVSNELLHDFLEEYSAQRTHSKLGANEQANNIDSRHKEIMSLRSAQRIADLDLFVHNTFKIYDAHFARLNSELASHESVIEAGSKHRTRHDKELAELRQLVGTTGDAGGESNTAHGRIMKLRVEAYFEFAELRKRLDAIEKCLPMGDKTEPAYPSFAGALKIMTDNLRSDQAHADAWHDNIACCGLDVNLPHDIANKVASRVMLIFFGVTTLSPLVRGSGNPHAATEEHFNLPPGTLAEYGDRTSIGPMMVGDKVIAGAEIKAFEPVAYHTDGKLYPVAQTPDVGTTFTIPPGSVVRYNITAKRRDDDEPITERWLNDAGFVKTCRDHDEWRMWGQESRFALWFHADSSDFSHGDIRLRTRRDLRLLCELLKIELKEGT